MPLVSVVIGAYNAEKTLRMALKSMCLQTFTDFEVIVVDNNSSDKTPDILDEFASKDSRIKLFSEKRQGLSYALNSGLARASGKFVARMDTDDISTPWRLATQASYLQKNPTLGACCGLVRLLHRPLRVWRKSPETTSDLRPYFLFKNPLTHPAMMLKSSIFTDNCALYAHGEASEDFELWIRLVEDYGVHFGSVKSTVLFYRLHSNNFGKSQSLAQRESADRCVMKVISNFGSFSPAEIEFHLDLVNGSLIWSEETLVRVEAWLLKLQEINASSAFYSPASLAPVLASQWFTACRRAAKYVSSLQRFLLSPLSIGLGVRRYTYLPRLLR